MQSTESVCCPYCGQQNEVPVEISSGPHQFTTDCEVCCRPFDVVVRCGEDGGASIEVG